MKYLKTYKQINEGLRDMMLGMDKEKAKEYIYTFKGNFQKLRKIIVYDLVWLIDEVIELIKDSEYDYQLTEQVLKLCIHENSIKSFIHLLNNHTYLIPNEQNKIKSIVNDIIYFKYWDFLEEFLKSDKVKDILHEDYYHIYSNLLDTKRKWGNE